MIRWLRTLLRWLDGADFRATLKSLRTSGQSIDKTVTFGRHIRLCVEKDSRLSIGCATQIMDECWISTRESGALRIGDHVFLSHRVTISGDVTIGNDCLIAENTTIVAENHVFTRTDLPIRMQGGCHAPIIIGNDVWIGAGVVITAGVTIGDHAVIGANSTVTHDIPEWAVAAGSPARVLRLRSKE